MGIMDFFKNFLSDNRIHDDLEKERAKYKWLSDMVRWIHQDMLDLGSLLNEIRPYSKYHDKNLGKCLQIRHKIDHLRRMCYDSRGSSISLDPNKGYADLAKNLDEEITTAYMAVDAVVFALISAIEKREFYELDLKQRENKGYVLLVEFGPKFDDIITRLQLAFHRPWQKEIMIKKYPKLTPNY